MRLPIPVLVGFLSALALPATAQSTSHLPKSRDTAARSFDTACAYCHYRGATKTPFRTNSPLGNDSPDELAQFVLFGKAPEDGETGMPAFGTVLTDDDVARLVTWLRSTSKPDAPWPNVTAHVAQMRASGAREE